MTISSLGAAHVAAPLAALVFGAVVLAMRWRPGVLRCAGVALAATVACAPITRAQAEDAGRTIVLKSASYASPRQFLAGAAPEAPADVPATLTFPPSPAGHDIPAVVVVHTLAGYREPNEGWQAAALRQAGFATLTYDSFAARHLGDLVNTPREGPPPYPSAFADAFAALAALSQTPGIDPKRIAILGFSFGGEVAHDTAYERVRAKLAAGEERFAAHVAYYPAGVFGTVAAAAAYTGAPVLMMVGEDDTLPIAKAKAYLDYAQAAGHPAPIELLTYLGAHHGWTNPELGQVRDYPYLASTRRCPFALITKSAGLMLLDDGHERPFDDGAFRACIEASMGYAMGYDGAIRATSTAAAIAFLHRQLGS